MYSNVWKSKPVNSLLEDPIAHALKIYCKENDYKLTNPEEAHWIMVAMPTALNIHRQRRQTVVRCQDSSGEVIYLDCFCHLRNVWQKAECNSLRIQRVHLLTNRKYWCQKSVCKTIRRYDSGPFDTFAPLKTPPTHGHFRFQAKIVEKMKRIESSMEPEAEANRSTLCAYS